MDVMSLGTNIEQNEGILKLSVTKHMKISTKTTLPWVPEDIFFLSILMVRGVVASTVSKVYFILGILSTDLWSQGSFKNARLTNPKNPDLNSFLDFY